MEAFLTRSGQNNKIWTVEQKGWPQDKWVGLIAPILSGNSQKAYYDSTSEIVHQKLGILTHLGVTTAVSNSEYINEAIRSATTVNNAGSDFRPSGQAILCWFPSPSALCGSARISRSLMRCQNLSLIPCSGWMN